MAEGGLFAWKTQRIDEHRGPAASYTKIQKPLPNPPKNMHWVLDDVTRDWSLEHLPQTVVVVEAEIVDEKDVQKDGSFTEHLVVESDTFAGICIKYRLTPTELRRANCFSGSNLNLAPIPLRIPIKSTAHEKVVKAIQVSPLPTETIMVLQMVKACRGMSRSEAKCYLDLNGWNLQDARKNAVEDGFTSS
jgi:hypothetical protein